MGNYVLFDTIRGLSAFLVVIGHMRNAIFPPYDSLNNPKIHDQFFYFITGFGHEAVIIFFVLSGFFVGGSVIKNVEQIKLSTYIIKRLTRLWIVLIPALILTAICDYFLPTDFLAQAEQSTINSLPLQSEYSGNVVTFVCNLLFLQETACVPFGTNSPLWSLAYEFWYYVLFPAIALLFSHTLALSSKIAVGIVIVVISMLLSNHILLLFPIWILGSCVFLAHTRIILNFAFKLVSLMVLLIILLVIRLQILDGLLADYILGISFSIFMITCIQFERTRKLQPLYIKASAFFANISFTLYAVHFPILMLIYSKTYIASSSNSILHYTYFAIIFSVIFSSTVLLWSGFERHTHKVQRLLLNSR